MGTHERYYVVPRDYRETVRALRAKAHDPVTPEPEREACLAKASELEAKYGNVTSRVTDDTIIINRSGGYNPFARKPGWRQPDYSDEYWNRYLADLLNRQWMWNREYYDQDGNPVTKPDVDNIYEDDYKYDEENDEDD